MSFLDIALRNAARGFKVLPVISTDGKGCYLKNWPELATTDRGQIEVWAAQYPEANCAVAVTDELMVLESDGLKKLEEMLGAAVPKTFTVQCREDRPHFYFWQTPKSKACGNNDLGGVFEFKQWHRYVIAEGSVRRAEPDAGLTYTVIDPSPIIPIPDWIVDKLPKKLKVAATPGEKVGHGGRHEYLTGVAGKLRNSGMGRDALEAALIPINDSMLTEPLPLSDLAHIAASVSRYPVPEPEPQLIISGTPTPKPVVKVEEKVVTDWRQHFHTKDEALNAPPITFLIKGFLQCEGVTAIAAPVRERKSLIALNVTHALLTGEKLFDHFEVVKKPDRVLYLCPEVSLGPFTDRVRKIGLLDYIGDRFFYRTMSAEGHLTLADAALQDALPGSVVILDTAIRFLEGDENSSAHIRIFADSIFALLRNGAEAVVLLHHSPKDMGDTMTLETAMRGSGDMGAFLASCWGTRLQDPTKPYESPSFLSNLKQRDFESQDLEVTCRPDCLMRIAGGKGLAVMAPRKNRANKDGLESKAMELLRAHPNMSVRDTVNAMKAAGIRRGRTWVMDKRYELMQVELSAVR